MLATTSSHCCLQQWYKFFRGHGRPAALPNRPPTLPSPSRAHEDLLSTPPGRPWESHWWATFYGLEEATYGQVGPSSCTNNKPPSHQTSYARIVDTTPSTPPRERGRAQESARPTRKDDQRKTCAWKSPERAPATVRLIRGAVQPDVQSFKGCTQRELKGWRTEQTGHRA